MTNQDADIARMDRQQLMDELLKLLAVIRECHSQHADDLCWMPADVNKIFEAAGLPPQDLHVGDKAAMLKNCERYVGCLQNGGPWESYASLEKSLKFVIADRDTYANKLDAAYKRIQNIIEVAGHLQPSDIRNAACWIVSPPHLETPRPEEWEIDARIDQRNNEIDRVEKIINLCLEKHFGELKEQIRVLKANHADLVFRNRLLRARRDLPVDRLPTHAEVVRLQEFKARALAAGYKDEVTDDKCVSDL
jgi:hypothetical protein